jgi:iron complex outermembrane receptor protein
MLHQGKLFWISLLLGTSQLLLAQSPRQVFSGLVLDASGTPVVEAVVEAEGGGGLALTDAAGAFRLVSERGGVSYLTISHLSFAPKRLVVETLQDTRQIHVVLGQALYELATVEVKDRPEALSSLLKSSQHVQVLTDEFIARRQTGTFAGALDDLAGVSTMKLGVGVAKPVIRGMSFNRILVNNWGIKQEGQQWGADHGLEVDPFDVAAVEVIKGPASLLYGSDGLGGVINILPQRFGSEDGTALHWTTGYQSNNHAISNSVDLKGRKQDWIYSARVTHQDYGDYTVPADEFTYAGFNLPIFDNRLKNTAGRELHYSALVGRETEHYRSTVRFSAFNQNAGIFTGAIGIPRSYNLRHQGRNRDIDFPRQRNRHFMLVNNNRYDFGQNTLEVDLGVQWNRREELSFPGAHGIDAAVVNSDLALGLALTTYTANARYRVEVRDNYEVLFGAQLQHGENRRDGFEFLLPNYRSTQLGVFNYHVWNFDNRWMANAGLRYDRGDHRVRQHLQPLYDQGTLLPTGEVAERTPAFERSFENLSGAAGLSFLPSEQHNFKLNLGNSFRIPTVIELASNGVHHGNFRHERGDADLDVERGYQVDLTYLYRGEGLQVEASAFYAYYQRYIYLSPSGRFSNLPAGGSLWQYRQDDALFNGAELTVGYELSENLKATAVGEYVQNLNLNTGLPLPLTPAASFQAELEYRGIARNSSVLNDTYLSFGAETFLAQNRVDRNELTTPGAFVLHANFGTQLSLGGRDFQLRVSLDNILNVAYFNHISRYRLINLPEQGRNLVVSLKSPLIR